ncbi:MAG: kinase [Gammaproteobacteria bacterium HGW-Gammaproteobacteria-8]|nr:MAG: kinase [Gammaproteobacteria bacterium HGW-Gammaproteobacteria-8]
MTPRDQDDHLLQRSANRLIVWSAQRPVGELWRDAQDRIGFAYDPSWLEQGFAIGHILPLQTESFDPAEGLAHAWFANLLPEGAARERIVRNLGIADDDFGLLRAIGGDCAGALSVLPVGQHPEDQGHVAPLTDAEFERMLAQRGQGILPAPESATALRPRLSLAGAQAKCPVVIEGERILLPLGATPSTHILKFELPEWRNVPVYEIFLSRLGAAVGLPVPNARMEQRGKHRFLVVDRYDRACIDGRWQRLHQEDFCQVAGLRPTRKYQSEGGPGLVLIADWIRQISQRPAEDLLHLIRWQAFNWLAGNSDGHAKNLSLVRPAKAGGGWRLAPFYDLVCTRAWPDLDRRLAMDIGGESDPGRIGRSHWEQAARALGMRPRFMLGEVVDLAQGIHAALPELRVELEASHGPLPMLQQVETVIRTQLSLARPLAG